MAAYDDEDPTLLMGSGLLGGANAIPLTPAERQQYIDGVTLKCKYVGTIEVPQSKGTQMMITAIGRVRAHHKSSKDSKQKVYFVISTSGVKIIDYTTRMLRDSYALEAISCVALLPSNKKVFGMVTVNASVTPNIFKCHVYKSDTKSILIAESMGRCFTLALEEQRNRKLLQQQQRRASMSGSRTASTPRGGGGQAWGGVINSPGRPTDLPTSFDEIIHALRVRLHPYSLSSEDERFFGYGLSELQRLYTAATQGRTRGLGGSEPMYESVS